MQMIQCRETHDSPIFPGGGIQSLPRELMLVSLGGKIEVPSCWRGMWDWAEPLAVTVERMAGARWVGWGRSTAKEEAGQESHGAVESQGRRGSWGF